MAKTESTAVNDLIKIATTQTPLAKDPSEDLMFSIPPKRDRSTKMVTPLPPLRVPHGTKEHAIAMPAMKAGGSPAKGTATVPPMPAIARTRTPLPPPLPSSRPSITVPPIAAPIEAPEFLTDSVDGVEPIATRSTRPSLPPPSRPAMPSQYPIVSAVHSLPMAPAPQPKLADAAPWADDDNSIDIDASEFRTDNTAQVARPRTNLEWVIKLAPWMGVMVVIGVAIGAYIVLGNKDGKDGTSNAAAPSVELKVVAEPTPAIEPTPAPAAAAIVPTETPVAPVAAVVAPTTEEPAVTPPNLAVAKTEAPIAAPIATPAPIAAPPVAPSITTPAPTTGAIAKRPAFVDVRIDSTPSGATVTLVDRGKQTFLGTTPISTAVDPSRAYEIVFSHPRRPTQTANLDPRTATRLAVTLGKTGRATPELGQQAAVATPVAVARVATPAASAPITPTVAKPAATKPAKVAKPAKIIEPTWDTPAEPAKKAEPAKIEKAAAPAPEKVVAPVAEKAVGGNGVLMISSKPPCEIHIDGKATGLMTPQRSLPLSAGKHKITLVNTAEKIKKSITVDITANETSKVIQNLMQ